MIYQHKEDELVNSSMSFYVSKDLFTFILKSKYFILFIPLKLSNKVLINE